MGARSVVASAQKSKKYNPSDLDHYSDIVALYFEQVRAHGRNHVEGGIVKDPTTGSSQLTGTGNTTWNADVEALIATVGGVAKELAVQADFSIHSGSYITGFANGTSVVAAIVLKNVAGTVTMDSVQGTPATTGTEVPPTDAEIQTGVGAGNDWVKVAECTLERDGDTSVAESQDNTVRPLLGVTVDAIIGDF